MTARPAGLRIIQITPGTPAERAGVREGDRILDIGGKPATDYLDIFFYENEKSLRLTLISRQGKKYKLFIEKDENEPLGIRVEDMRIRRCRNKCVFCFSDQNPPGLRPSLYFKDEDYRYSFLFGHYVTLSHVTDDELDRIARLRLHPLYISIHAVNETVRKRLLGRRTIRPILPTLEFLAMKGITFHGQIVVCPGINDENVLLESIDRLSELRPALLSLALIPVGLTRYRKGLPAVHHMDAEAAGHVIEMWKQVRHSVETGWIMVSDEMLLTAGEPIPPASMYGSYPQLENGVGLIRMFIDDALKRPPLPVNRRPEKPIYWITGQSAAPFLSDVLKRWLPESAATTVRVIPVPNRFWGDSITVAGLITGRDMIYTIKKMETPSLIMFPSNMLEQTGTRFLDDISVREISREMGVPVIPVDPDAESAYKMLATWLDVPKSRIAMECVDI